MTKLVVLKLNGNFKSGFKVNLEVGAEGQSAESGFAGSLPPASKLSQALSVWQQKYLQLARNSRIKPQQIIYDGSVDPQRQLATVAKKLQHEFEEWLNSSSFYAVDKHLREELHRTETIRLIICSDLPQIYQLPWSCWDLLENYPHLEIALSNFDFKRVAIKPKIRRHNKVKILAILGDSRSIDLNADCHFLSSLDTGEVTFLKEPTRQELYTYLWSDSWDIVFFAGHSLTIARQGLLYLNQSDRLTIEQLKYGFSKAISNGLQLAIFNSCDGLGIAEELGKLFLPQSIVMRMPVPDVVAQEFIKHFLQGYAAGKSLYLATKMARQQLQAKEKEHPCASWLPIIYQNPAIIPPDWSDLCVKKRFESFLRWSRQQLVAALCSSAIALIIVALIQSWGWLEAGELKAYDRLVGYRYTAPTEKRVLVITIDDRDIKFQQQQGLATNMRGSLSDRALNMLLERLQAFEVKAIASDVIHDFPFEPELKKNIARTDNFFAICRIESEQPKLVSINAPASLPVGQTGFSNWAIDDDGTIRRQILGMSPDNVCQSSVSLSLRLAIKYLDGIPFKYERRILQIGSTKFPRLKPTSGGYHLPEAQGYQTLLNYPRDLPQTITLQEALTKSDRFLKPLVKDKIVLIGVVGYNQDLHYTPYSQGKQAKRLSGVIIHAQMTSSIVSAVLNEKMPLRWLGDRLEILWISIWCVFGSIIALLYQNSLAKMFWSILFALVVIFGCSWILLLNSVWAIAIAPCLGLLLSAVITAVCFE